MKGLIKALAVIIATITATMASPVIAGFTSGNDFNSINQSYTANSTINQTIVFDGNMQGADSLNFQVQIRNGGGRPTIAPTGYTAPTQLYPTNVDSATITIRFYDSTGTLINSAVSSTYTLESYADNAGNPGWSSGPGDNIYDWTNGSLNVTNIQVDSGSGFSQVAYAEVEMKGSDGSWWAGNYGVQWRAPTMTYSYTDGNGQTQTSTNVLYNPEFGPDSSGTQADGWTSSNNYGTCGTNSGSTDCVTNGGVTANASGGGEDPNGGTTSGTPGGYNSTFSIATFSGSSGDGTITDTSAAPAPVYVSSITTAQTATKTAALATTTGNQAIITITGNDNDVDVSQLSNGNFVDLSITGSDNIVDITQVSSTLARHFAEIELIGDDNQFTFSQSDAAKTAFISSNGDLNVLNITQKDGGLHYLSLANLGDSAQITILQEGAGNHSATIDLENGGGNWIFDLTQSGTTDYLYSLPHNLTDNSVVTGVCYSGTCNMTIVQQ
jgi:hypothetical protein